MTEHRWDSEGLSQALVTTEEGSRLESGCQYHRSYLKALAIAHVDFCINYLQGYFLV